MNITKKTRLAIGVVGLSAAVGLAAGGAFTGTGVITTGQANAPQFVGGTVTQTVTGATLNSIVYAFTDATKIHPNQVTLTFTGETVDGLHVAIVLTGGTPATWTCEDIGATTTLVSICTISSGGPATAIDSIAVTVS